jgi:hypothetical protein
MYKQESFSDEPIPPERSNVRWTLAVLFWLTLFVLLIIYPLWWIGIFLAFSWLTELFFLIKGEVECDRWFSIPLAFATAPIRTFFWMLLVSFGELPLI